MTITDDAWTHPDPDTVLRLVRIPVPVVHALARGDATDDRHVTPYLVGDGCSALWQMRSRQLRERPDDGPWLTRYVVADGEGPAVGLAGFHGAPDERGMVEVGYRIDPARRRQGYARESLEILLAVAGRHREIRIVRATIAPGNDASRSLVERHGFQVVGEQWDDEDGREIVFETAAGEGRPTPS